MNSKKDFNKLYNMQLDDICSSCNNLNNCLYIKNKKFPLYFCEEFNNTLDKEEIIISQNKKQIVSSYDHKLKGLCINCENRFDCNHEKPEGGIWHCEEYL
ncbi:MAG: hypothetical protein JXB50_06570 [Spirochaetes bacterium]|nr:hypothetical protein [Spirochaetota bacterium]